MIKKIDCPIWGTVATSEPDGGAEMISSNRAGGKYIITGSAKAKASQNSRAKLSSYILRQNQLGIAPEINSSDLDAIWSSQLLSYTDRFNLLLKTTQKLFPRVGEPIEINRINGDINYASLLAAIECDDVGTSSNILDYSYLDSTYTLYEYWQHAAKLGYMTYESDRPAMASLNLEGFLYLEKLGRQLNANDQIFVAMWFGQDRMREFYDKAIKPAIEGAGYNSMRIDDSVHNEKIDDEIIAEIKKSKAVIADITCGLAIPDDWSTANKVGAPRGGVFYEAGFAKGLGLPVIWTVDETVIEVENVSHFDIRQYNQIRWTENFNEARERIQNRIEATLGRGNARHDI